MHNPDLSDDQKLILDTVVKFVEERARPRALDLDEHRTFAEDDFRQLAELGLLGLPIAEASGGAAMGMMAFAIAVVAVARGSSSTARLLVSQAGLVGKALEGLDAAAETCAAVAAGEVLAAFVGPDARIVAREEGAEFVLDGVAAVVTAGARAETFVVCARTAAGEPLLFVLDAKLVQRAAVPAAGFRATAPGSVTLRSVRVPASALVARDADAQGAFDRAMVAAAIGAAAIAVGIAEHTFEITRRHAHDRIAFGKPLFAQQAVAHKLVEIVRRTHAAQHLVYHAARIADLGGDALHEAMLAKVEAVESAIAAADEGIQVHGGFGYTVEYHVERHYRDAKALEVMDLPLESIRDRLAERIAL